MLGKQILYGFGEPKQRKWIITCFLQHSWFDNWKPDFYPQSKMACASGIYGSLDRAIPTWNMKYVYDSLQPGP